MDLTVGMIDGGGNMTTDRDSIVEIFAKFYEDLYESRQAEEAQELQGDGEQEAAVEPFDEIEMDEALKKIKKGRAADEKGLVAEMLKQGGENLRRVLLGLMNSVISPDAPPPKEWKENVFKVLFKSGDRRQAKNYRPICVLPLLYKLFSTMLYSRLQPVLEKELQQDQAGFRKLFSTVDHLHAFAQIQEKSSECNVELWTCFLDFQKAFDSVEHKAIWEELGERLH